MSFEELRVPELKTIAEGYGVDIGDIKTKREIIERLTEEGVTYEDYASLHPADDDENEIQRVNETPVEAPVDKGKMILVKMNRQNPYYELVVKGKRYVFETRHPFVPMPEDHAQEIFDNEEGFVVANPAEAKTFYG